MTSRVVRIAALAIAAAAIVLLLTLPVSEYDWMRDMDPSIPPGTIVDNGSARVAAGLTALIGVATGTLAAWFSRGIVRWVAVAAAVIVAVIWAVKFAA
ncbi:hypothetical protein [Sphingomonas sp.]|uniref:hypothetical protein n=1 Tax=Sphingomonas sp. TaxID=28214 RepID=UPI0035BC0CFC